MKNQKISNFIDKPAIRLTGYIATLQRSEIQITFPSIVVSILYVLSLIFIIFILLRRLKQNVKFYEDRDKSPSKFKIENILKSITKNKLNLTVIGRTNSSWFNEIDKTRELYKKALNQNCIIKFIIQHEFVENNNVEDEVKRKIIEDHQTVKNAYKQLYDDFKHNSCFQLFLTKNVIENSMTNIYKGEVSEYFSYDIGLTIKKNPFLIFHKNSW